MAYKNKRFSVITGNNGDEYFVTLYWLQTSITGKNRKGRGTRGRIHGQQWMHILFVMLSYELDGLWLSEEVVDLIKN